ncbi:MAG: hypothetical protein IPM23_09580 [Candidatus Melainabacteria bacterium]|nr:hypothetical protein [Candidatus Melainabacteria bacterium]
MSERSSFDPDYFPDNLPECHRVISELRAEVKRLQALEAIVEELRKKVANLETQVKNQKRPASAEAPHKSRPLLSLAPAKSTTKNPPPCLKRRAQLSRSLLRRNPAAVVAPLLSPPSPRK